MEFFAKTFDELTTKEFIQILKSMDTICGRRDFDGGNGDSRILG